jgi:hypothetical protein
MNIIVVNRINHDDILSPVKTSLFSENEFRYWVETFCTTNGVTIYGEDYDSYEAAVYDFFAVQYNLDVMIEKVEIEDINNFNHLII